MISLGGGLDSARLGKLAGDPLVVRFAPQLEILKRAVLVITHAGLNTVLESLSEGVPLVACPSATTNPEWRRGSRHAEHAWWFHGTG